MSGAVLIDGRDVTGVVGGDNGSAGSVPCSRLPADLSFLTVRENLRMAFRYSVPKGEVEDRIANVLELFPALGRHVST